ncbi:MAG: hypothetical protein H6625_06900 [Bdellovibrionaceae bacterium]|nr:hypothetical protein [Pseudobdellovibrionaceae bacterium]
MRNYPLLILFVTLIFGLSCTASELTDSRKKLFEGFNDSPRHVVKRLSDFLTNYQDSYEKAAKEWYNLHLQIDENWQEVISLWPENVDFQQFVDNSPVITLNDDISGKDFTGFLAFHTLPDYERLNDIYEQPYYLNFATGIELALTEDESNQNENSVSLRNTQPLRPILIKNLLELHRQIEHIVDEITLVRLKLEIVTDQIKALDIGKDNGYYIRHLNPKSANKLLSLSERTESLLNQIKKLRTHYLLGPLQNLSGMIHSVSFVQYSNTSEFKKDLNILIQNIKAATPQLSSFGRSFSQLLKELGELEERNHFAKNFTFVQNQALLEHVNQLFSKLNVLVSEEKNILNENPERAHKHWMEWLTEHQKDYAQIFFELYEILDYPAEMGTPLYDFQVKYFQLNSDNRKTFRYLETLLFGNSEVNSLNQTSQIKDRMTSKIKFRSSILDRMIFKANPSCDQILTY